MASDPTKDELTEKMHNEFTIDNETDKKHIAWSSLYQLKYYPNMQTLDRLFETTGLSQSDLDKYRPEWESLQ